MDLLYCCWLADAPSRFFSGTAALEWTSAANSAGYLLELLEQLSMRVVLAVKTQAF